MNILLIRHSHAEDRKFWDAQDLPDSFRPLTKKGKKNFYKVSMNINKMIDEIDGIYSSQYTRAIETAEILAVFYKKTNLEVISTLNYMNNNSVFENKSSDQTIAFVGHQPELGNWVSQLLNNKQDAMIRFKKGGVACLKYFEGRCELKWLLTSDQIKALDWS